jgi:hypothetical protein
VTRGIPTMKIEVPLAAGRNAKADPRALEPPALDRCVDAVFDEVGGLQTRLPYAALGPAIADARRIVANGDELLVFTKDALFSRSASQNEWISRGTHLAVKVDEESTFVTTGDQVDPDRAELGGLVVFVWTDGASIAVGVKDKTTGAVLLAPSSVTGTRARLVALATKILLFWKDGSGNLVAQAIDPAGDPADIPSDLASPTTVLAAASFNDYYDVVKQPGADTAVFATRRDVTTSYTIGTVTAGLSVSTSTKARTCDGAIAVSCPPAGTTVQVIRGNGTNVQGDYITIASFVDVTTGQAIGTISASTVTQIAAAHRSVADGGAFRCYVFWDSEEATGSSGWTSKFNFVDTAGTIGTQANFVRQLAVASRAFDHGGRVFVTMAFAGASGFSGASGLIERSQLQNTYFLYRDDAFLAAKAVGGRAGGFSPSTGRLPGVALTDGTTGYSWCATERRIITLGGANHTGYDARAPREVVYTFDSNEARRCARLGQTLYVSGGEILQYDGVQLVESGFHIYPWYFGAIEVGTGNLADGTYTLKVTWRWDNARGERDSSTTATSGQVDIAAGPNGISIVDWVPLFVTHKTASAIGVEVWRTVLNAGLDAPFYLVTSKDPAVTSNPNRYVPNAPTSASLATFNDELADASITSLETNPENGGVLENLAPPAASIIVASDTRLFLAGVAGDPTRVWYSKHRGEGEVAAFHDALTVEVPPIGGDITALAFLFDTLVVFKEAGVYALRGDGFDNLGGGSNFVPQLVSTDVGATSHEAIGLTPMGLLFKSAKGWYLLGANLGVQYVGGAISDYDGESPLAVHVVESRHQVRCLTANRLLVWDYLVNQWGEHSIADGLHATIWGGTYTYLTSTGAKAESATYTSLTYGIDVETAWIKPAELQGQGRVRRILALGEYRSAHSLRVRLARDYEYDDTGAPDYFDDVVWTPSTLTHVVGSREQFQIGPRLQRAGAIKIRLTAIGGAAHATFVTTDFLLGGSVSTSPGPEWVATLQARTPGVGGNDLRVVVSVVFSTDNTVEVRDHQVFDPTAGTWSSSLNRVGILLRSDASGLSVASLESAINGSELIRVSTPSGSPAAIVTNDTTETFTGGFAGGVDPVTSNPPTGEALKLTGLALLVGVEPGVFRRLSTSQKAGA